MARRRTDRSNGTCGMVLLVAVRDALFAYWHDYDCVVYYYIFHLFVNHLLKTHSEILNAMPFGASRDSLVLMNHWNENFCQQNWDRVTSMVCFHKLSCRAKAETLRNKQNFYHKIIEA